MPGITSDLEVVVYSSLSQLDRDDWKRARALNSEALALAKEHLRLRALEDERRFFEACDNATRAIEECARRWRGA